MFAMSYKEALNKALSVWSYAAKSSVLPDFAKRDLKNLYRWASELGGGEEQALASIMASYSVEKIRGNFNALMDAIMDATRAAERGDKEKAESDLNDLVYDASVAISVGDVTGVEAIAIGDRLGILRRLVEDGNV